MTMFLKYSNIKKTVIIVVKSFITEDVKISLPQIIMY